MLRRSEMVLMGSRRAFRWYGSVLRLERGREDVEKAKKGSNGVREDVYCLEGQGWC